MTEADIRRIRLVTRHFYDLQGLTLVVLGSVEIVWGLVWLETHNLTVIVLLVAGSVLAFIWPKKYLDRYYAGRFGRVQGGGGFPLPWVIVLSLATPLLLQDRWQPAGTSVFILVLGSHPAWLLFDGWPDRRHYLVAVGATVLAGVMAFHAGSPSDAIARAFVLFGISEIPCGLADHALLVRTMRGLRAWSSDAQASERGE